MEKKKCQKCAQLSGDIRKGTHEKVMRAGIFIIVVQKILLHLAEREGSYRIKSFDPWDF